MAAIIDFKHVNKYYGKFHALKDINLSIEEGQVVSIIGPSGSGKSTLIRTMNGLERINSGTLMVSLLMNEQLQHVAFAHQITVLDVMKYVADQGITMVVVTHEMGFAREVGDRLIFFDQGRILEDAKPEEFFEHPKTERARQFLSKVITEKLGG